MKTGIDANGKTTPGMTPLLRVATLFLGLSAILLVWVGVGTVQASRDTSVRAGLDYEAFLRAVDDLIAGAGDSALISFHEVEEELSRRRSVRFDTIAILVYAIAIYIRGPRINRAILVVTILGFTYSISIGIQFLKYGHCGWHCGFRVVSHGPPHPIQGNIETTVRRR